MSDELESLRARLERERAARREAEDIAERATAQLYARQRELEQVNQDLETFAARASHDLVEPLRTIAGFAQLLQRRNADQLDEKGLQFLEYIVAGAARGQRLVGDLLSFTRAGTMPVETEEISLDDAVEAALSELGQRVRESGAEVAVATPLGSVRADRGLLVRVLANLLGNAIKYVAAGTVPAVRVAATRGDGQVELTVADNGVGISGDDSRRVFDLFVRVGDPDAAPGTGVGLATTQKIVERHGGRVWVTAGEGGGSVFHVSLPGD